MKKLSFSLVIALICISMFSCDEKSVVNPQNEDCTITGLSSYSGASSSTVTLYGKNLTKESDLIVKFGEQNAGVLSRSDDSIAVKVPNIPEGLYEFHAVSKARKELFITKFDLRKDHFNIDFSQFKNFEVYVKGLKLKFKTIHEWTDEVGGGKGDWLDYNNSFSKMVINSQHLTFLSIVKGFYKYSEYLSVQEKSINNSISFSVDDLNCRMKSISLDFYESSSTSTTSTSSSRSSTMNIDLKDVAFEISDDGSALYIKLNKNGILANMANFDAGSHNVWKEWYSHNRSSDDTMKLVEILGINDDATIEIKFTK